MNPLVLAASAASGLTLAAGALVLRKRRVEAASEIATQVDGDVSGLDPLVVGGLYRVSLSCDPSWVDTVHGDSETGQKTVETAIGSALVGTGFRSVQLVVQDPSDPNHELWSVLATSGERFDPMSLPPSITVNGWERIQPVSVPQSADVPGLDAGLNVDEVWAIGFALDRDHDPQRLEGFGSTFDVDFPVASGLLRSKARLETLARQVNATVGAVRTNRIEMGAYRRAPAVSRRGFVNQSAIPLSAGGHGGPRPGHTESIQVSGLFDWVPQPLKDAANAVVDTLSDAADVTGVGDLWKKYGGVVEVMGGWIPGPQIWAIETAARAAAAIDSGENVGRALTSQMVRFADGLRQAAPLVAYVPGIGQGVAVALEASAILALCGLGQGCPPIDQAAIELVATQVPGGPITQGAFRGAVSTGYALASGRDPGDAALEGIRAGLPTDEAKVAFDAGLALSRGETLAEAGFQVLRSFARGNTLAEQGLEYADAIRGAAESGRPVKDVLLDVLVRDVRSLRMADLPLRDALGQTIEALQSNPELLANFPADLGDQLGVAEEIARAGLSAVQDLGNGVVIVDPDVTRKLFPPITASNAMLLIASSRYRPSGTPIYSAASLAQRNTSWTADNADNPAYVAQLKANQQARAQRAVDRLNWVRWYRAAQQNGML